MLGFARSPPTYPTYAFSVTAEPNNSRIGLTLLLTQYAFYQSTYLELLTPTGEHLECLGKTVQRDNAEHASYGLRDQVALVACLLGGIQDAIQLPLPAVLGLADLFYRMQGEWGKR